MKEGKVLSEEIKQIKDGKLPCWVKARVRITVLGWPDGLGNAASVPRESHSCLHMRLMTDVHSEQKPSPVNQ